MTRIPSARPKPAPIAEAFKKADYDALASVYFGIHDNITDHGNAYANIVVAPVDADGTPDWDKAHPTNLEKPSSDSGPANMAEAKRWAILVDDISGCDDNTSMLVWLDPVTGEPQMTQVEGPTTDGEIAMRIVGRDIGARPPAKDYKPGSLAASLSRFMSPANDNPPPAGDPLLRRLEALQGRYGGHLFRNSQGWPCLIAVSFDGAVGTIEPDPTGGLIFTRPGRKPVSVEETPVTSIEATAWRLPDPRAIPPREWLYGHHYIRKFVTVTISPGGVGKTSLGMAEALSMVTGRELLGIHVHRQANVWIWNGEDPQDELDRRLASVCRHYGISGDEIAGRLFVNSGRTMPLITATQTRDGTKIAVPVVDALVEQIQRNRIDVMVVDPFVSSHAITENDNMAMDQVIKQTWAIIAERTNCAIELVHHAKKLGGTEVNAESARGATSLIGAARSARVLNPMSAEEASKFGVDNRHRFFRVNDAKSNMAPRSERAEWYNMIGHDLGNATRDRPSDHVGVAVSWKAPNPMDDVRASDLLAAQRVINAGSYRDSIQAKDWVGHAVAEAMGLDVGDDRDKATIKACLVAWKKSGALVVEDRECADRKIRPHVIVGEWAHDT